MMRKFIRLLLCLLLIGSLAITVSATGQSLVIDEAGIFQETDIQTLTEQARKLKDTYGIDAVILTVQNLGGKDVQSYADDYYDSLYGEDGVLMLLAMDEREYYITTSGEVIYALTDYALYQMEEQFLDDLASGDYYSAFQSYLSDTDYYMNAYRSTGSVDGFVPEEDIYSGHDDVVYADEITYEDMAGTAWLISAGIGLIVAGIAIAVMRGTMNTKVKQYAAEDYLKEDSYHLTRTQDLFLYSQVTKRRRPEEDTTRSSGGGGSGVHSSSSGRSHGGRGGKF